MSISNSAAVIQVTPELIDDFNAVVRIATPYAHLGITQVRAPLKVPYIPEDSPKLSEHDLVMQWIWQTMIIASHLKPEVSPEQMLKYLREDLEGSKNPMARMLHNQMGLNGNGKKLKEEGNFPGIPDIPQELADACVPSR